MIKQKLPIITLGTLLFSSLLLNADTLEKTLHDNTIYVGTSLGYTHISSDKTTTQGSVPLNNKLKSPSKNLNLELGFEYSNNIDLSINYQRVNNDNVSLDNTYISLKYKLNKDKLTPYVAANLGYSQMSWEKDPIDSKNNDANSGSYLLGVKLGSYYTINDNVDLDLNYNLSYTDHETKLNPSVRDSAVIKHDYLHSFNVGFKFDF